MNMCEERMKARGYRPKIRKATKKMSLKLGMNIAGKFIVKVNRAKQNELQKTKIKNEVIRKALNIKPITKLSI